VDRGDEIAKKRAERQSVEAILGGPYLRGDGYMYLCFRYSDAVRDYEYVTEHRWVMEQHLGRKLKPSEHVHHVDGNKANNKISNLRILSNREHGLMKHFIEVYECHNCGKKFNSRTVVHVYCSASCREKYHRRSKKGE